MRKVQGQSISTIDKERRIGAALSVGMRIANARFGGKRYPFWFLDANCGTGHNAEVNVRGSPLVFWDVSRMCLPLMLPVAHFCDHNADAISQLKRRFAHMADASDATVWHCDNGIALRAFANRIQQQENPQFAIGSVLFDPNGYFWHTQVPVGELEWFTTQFPRIDIILNLNIRTYHLQRGAGHAVLPPAEVLASLHRSNWLVARAGGQNRHLLAVGRNIPTGDHKALGFYKAESEIGQRMLNVTRPEADQYSFEEVA